MGGCLELIRGLFRSTRSFNIDGKRLKEIHQIAEGGYGYILLVQDTDSKKHYALKKLICQTEEQKQNFKNEVEVMKKLSGCRHVVSYHGSYSVLKDGFL
jgi:serine/threonine protein kinase